MAIIMAKPSTLVVLGRGLLHLAGYLQIKVIVLFIRLSMAIAPEYTINKQMAEIAKSNKGNKKTEDELRASAVSVIEFMASADGAHAATWDGQGCLERGLQR